MTLMKRSRPMDLDRLSYGERIAGTSAVVLFVLMFFDWFGVESSDESLNLFSVGRSPWEALDYIPILLLIAVVATLAKAALRLTNTFSKLAASTSAVIAILGTISVMLILFRIISPPDFGSIGTSFGTVTYEGSVQWPIFLSLVSAAGIAYGGYRAMREEGHQDQE